MAGIPAPAACRRLQIRFRAPIVPPHPKLKAPPGSAGGVFRRSDPSWPVTCRQGGGGGRSATRAGPGPCASDAHRSDLSGQSPVTSPKDPAQRLARRARPRCVLRLGGYGARPRELLAPGTVGRAATRAARLARRTSTPRLGPAVSISSTLGEASGPLIGAVSSAERNAAASSIRRRLKVRIRPAWSSRAIPSRALGRGGPHGITRRRRSLAIRWTESPGSGGANPPTDVSTCRSKRRRRRGEPEESRLPDRREGSLRPGFTLSLDRPFSPPGPGRRGIGRPPPPDSVDRPRGSMGSGQGGGPSAASESPPHGPRAVFFSYMKEAA
jgi:hypothetical protein